MCGTLRVYGANGFDGPMRRDNALTIEGEPKDRPGYAVIGKVFAIGYVKGIMKSAGIVYE